VPNLYGVSNPITYPQALTTPGFASIACNAGVETAIFTSSPFIALSSGIYYVYIQGAVTVLVGATSPTSVYLYAHIAAGADWTNLGFAQAQFPANASVIVPFLFVSPTSEVPWRSPGSTVTVSLTAAAQNVTAVNYGSNCYMGLFRAPDQ
jgi:hypothetical protein